MSGLTTTPSTATSSASRRSSGLPQPMGTNGRSGTIGSPARPTGRPSAASASKANHRTDASRSATAWPVGPGQGYAAEALTALLALAAEHGLSRVVADTTGQRRLPTHPRARGLPATGTRRPLPLRGAPRPPRVVGEVEVGEVDVDAGWCGQDELGLVGSQGVGAGVVDEVAEAVGGLPEVAAGAGLSAAVAAVGLPAVVSPAQGAGVVGAGLPRWPVPVVGVGVVEVDAGRGWRCAGRRGRRRRRPAARRGP